MLNKNKTKVEIKKTFKTNLKFIDSFRFMVTFLLNLKKPY